MEQVVENFEVRTDSIATIAKPLDAVLAELVQAYLNDQSRVDEGNLYRTLKTEIEKGTFLAAMRHARGNKTRAADLLGINRKILSEKILRYFQTTVVGKAYQSKDVTTAGLFDGLRQDVYDLAIDTLEVNEDVDGGLYRYIISNIEDAVMKNLLQRTKGNQTQAARMMGIGRSVFCQKIKRTPE